MAGNAYVQAIGPSYHLADLTAAVQDAVNCYPKKLDGTKWMLDATPGEATVTTHSGACRGMRDVNGRLFKVYGNTLFEGTGSTNRGTLATSTGPVSMAHNATQLAIVDGDHLYIFNTVSNALTEVTVPGWLGSDNVAFMDGYFIFVDPQTEQFYISAIDDGTSLDALDFSSADSQPDDILCHKVSHQQLYLFGKDSGEIWVNSGAADFPFTRYGSYTIDIGIAGKYAAINAADTIVFVGQTTRGGPVVYMIEGNQPKRISTNAVEEALKASSDISAVTMWAYQDIGCEFIGINAPGLSTTWVFDAATNEWHEEAEWADGWQAKKTNIKVAFSGEVYGGDADGLFVRLDTDLNQRSTRVIRRQRTWPHMSGATLELVSYRGVELHCRAGSGGNMVLQISNDGGYNFGNMLLRTLGATGRWVQRVRWLGLGTATRRVFRIWCTDNVPFGLYQAAVEV